MFIAGPVFDDSAVFKTGFLSDDVK